LTKPGKQSGLKEETKDPNKDFSWLRGKKASLLGLNSKEEKALFYPSETKKQNGVIKGGLFWRKKHPLVLFVEDFGVFFGFEL
jgi:hypothetical protein